MGARTPAARSTLSVSYTTKDHLEEVGIEPGGVNIDEKPSNLEESGVETKVTGDEMIIDSPVRLTSEQARVGLNITTEGSTIVLGSAENPLSERPNSIS
jgi:hypothetical protein